MLTPNIGGNLRIFYVVLGIALVAAPFAIDIEGPLRWVLPVLGLMAMVTGAVGW